MSARRISAVAALAVAVAAFLTRANQSLSYDELFTVWVSSRPWSELIHQANLDGFTPPLFYALVKLFVSVGIGLENLRVVPIAFAGLAVFAGLDASLRLFGPRPGAGAQLLIPASAYLFTFAHELRPYSALLACTFFVLGRLGGPADAREDRTAGAIALLATCFSYLGLFLVVLWLIECRRRVSKASALALLVFGLALCVPAFAKIFTMRSAAAGSSILWPSTGPSLSAGLFGLAPMPSGGWIEGIVAVALIGLIGLIGLFGWTQWLSPHDASLRFLSRSFLLFSLMLVALDAVIRIGFAPRYLVLMAGALLLLQVGALARGGHAATGIACLLLALHLTAIVRYLTVQPGARENWREAMTRIETRLGGEGIVLAFPFHHAAVAAEAFAPRLRLGGGYTSRQGPTWWYEPPAVFHGYSFTELRKLDDPRETFRRLALASDICLLSDEVDPTKTASVFQAFDQLGETSTFATGDPRLRALCRKKW